MKSCLSFDFSTWQNNVELPHVLGAGILIKDGEDYNIADEISPVNYWRVEHTHGHWALCSDRHEVILPSGHIAHHGVLCFPTFVPSQDVVISLEYLNPLLYFSSKFDQFFVRIILAGRSSKEQFIGSQINSIYSPTEGHSGINIVYFDKKLHYMAHSKEIAYNQLNELKVIIRSNRISVIHNGIIGINKEQLSKTHGNQILLWVEVYSELNGEIVSYPVVTKINAYVYDDYRNVRHSEVSGNNFVLPLAAEHFYRLPIRKLMDEKKVVQLSGNTFQFNEDTDVEYDGVFEMKASSGAIVVAHRNLLNASPYQWCKVEY